MMLIIDNYDSFTYNLVQYFGSIGENCQVYRNDKITVDEARELNPDFLVISPGPKTPSSAGVSVDFIKEFAGKVPILGVCLGHQCIGEAFGATIVHSKKLMHGKTSLIEHDSRGVFAGIANPFTVIRYHSLALDAASLPDCLLVSAVSDDGEVMGIRHRDMQIEGVQFHPESILTDHGLQILCNFTNMRTCKSAYGTGEQESLK